MMCSQLYLVFLVVGISSESLKGRYTRDIKDYEVVVPKKISGDGKFISYYLPHYYNIARVRRGADTGKVHYLVPINGEQRVLELVPSEEFHAPGMVIEHHEQDARRNVNVIKLRRPRKANCYYHGKVKDAERSSAAITACSGLAGAISLGQDQYLIEPVEDDGVPSEGPKHKHLLYRDDRKTTNYSSCGMKEDLDAAFRNRMAWEDQFGNRLEEFMTNKEDVEDELFGSTRKKRWCTTCRPEEYIPCQTPFPSCLLERPLFIEILIVVGHRIADQQFLSGDIEQYVNTIMNIVVRHFMDASVGRPILVKLVRVITLGFTYPDLDSHRYEADDLLQRFCDWQLHFNPKKEAHPNHHDYAIYLVKFGTCKNLFGLTNLAGMCRPDKSCGVIGQEGLLTGHIMTHMIAHSLGADHDEIDASGCCPEEPDGTRYHMARYITTRASSFSTCTKQCIRKFAETHAAWCMSDIPTAVDLTEPTLLPGQVYSAAEQCRINFEMETQACLVGEFCKRLYCRVSETECASKGEPPAQGTRCGPDQWCFNERCVHRGSRPGAVNGEWGMWSPWSPCTKTCGGGVQTANRACDSPAPTMSGRLCPGTWVKSRMCNIGACADGGKGFLDQQCRNTNVRPYHGRNHQWLYFNQQVEDLKCSVTCINERNEVAMRFPLAVDGTYCNPGTKDVCIRGECIRVGCDWVIGSKAKEDACGICHGNGTECRIMQGFFTESNFKGNIPFLKLPIGTGMILIRETRPSPCYFIISNSLNSTYYLNNDDVDDQTFFTGGVFRIKSTVGIYQQKAQMERIFIRDQISAPITVSTYCKEIEENVGILYQYALPEPMPKQAKYSWEHLSWEKCPSPCGGAIQRSMPVCVEAQGGEVEDSYCAHDTRPHDKIRVCNPRPCEAKWWVGPWVDCECYLKSGITTRMVMCAHMKEAKSSYIQLVPEVECLIVPKPNSIKPCDPVKNQEMWRRKGYTKRDVTDIIPYTAAVEDWTVWDEVPEESSPYLANVRHVLESMDPENIQDYLYMKKVGISSEWWKKMQQTPQRIRKRRKVVAATLNPNVHEAIYRSTLAKTDHVSKQHTKGNHHMPRSVQTTTSYAVTKKKSHLLEVKTFVIKRNKVKPKKRSDNRIPSTHSVISTVFQKTNTGLKATGRGMHTTEALAGKPSSTRAGHRENRTTRMSAIHSTGILMMPRDNTGVAQKMVTKMSPGRQKTILTVVISGVTKADNHKSTEGNVRTTKRAGQLGGLTTTAMVHLNQTLTAAETHNSQTTADKCETTASGGKTKHGTSRTGSTASDTKAETTTEEVTENNLGTNLDGKKRGTTVNRRNADEHSETTLQGGIEKQGVDKTAASTYDSALSTCRMTSKATTTPYGKCWRSEIKPEKEPVPCRPKEDSQPEPAEEAPEFDFFNTSKVKIYVVPIKTTIRTIIQNDQEYVIMETLAKYPVGDELNVIEHWGDNARKQLKLVKDRAERSTPKSLVQD